MDDGFRAKLLDAMRWDDKQLRAALDKAQLDAWYRTTRECAEKTVAVTYDRITAAKRAAAAEEERAARVRARALAQAQVDGQVDVNVNGQVQGRGQQVNGTGKSKLVIKEREERRTMPGGLFGL